MGKNKVLEIIKRIPHGIKPGITYIVARIILLSHYDKKLFINSKWFLGGKYGNFNAPGWSWVVDDYISCKKMRVNRTVPFPVSPRIVITKPGNIMFHPDDLNNFQGYGVYYQSYGNITIGRGTYIAPNVGIITSNHSIYCLDEHDEPKSVTIGENCWIGMNSVVLPGVVLGNHTIVGAGSIVTKSFPEGKCVIAGNPATLIKVLHD